MSKKKIRKLLERAAADMDLALNFAKKRAAQVSSLAKKLKRKRKTA